MDVRLLLVVLAAVIGEHCIQGLKENEHIYLVAKGQNNLSGSKSASQSGLVQRITRSLRRVFRSVDSDNPDIESLRVVSKVSSRYAMTSVESMIKNPDTIDKEAYFTMMIPDTAFISNFTMLIDGELYIANVKEKEAANQEYEQAKKDNKTAGMVKSETPPQMDRQPGLELFSISVNIAANSSVVFDLTYQELVQRKLGLYEVIISIRPNQLVKDLSVDVSIYEPQGVRYLDVLEPSSNSVTLQDAQITDESSQLKHIAYKPSLDRQKSIDAKKGIDGNLVIRYDVDHEYNSGALQISDGYFVHYFSPEGNELSPLGKNIVFVIDVSGSMGGEKIVQTRESLLLILSQLRSIDRFQLLLFSSETKVWRTTLMEAVSQNIERAKDYVREYVVAGGGTNIHDGLVDGADILKNEGSYGANVVVFLTDGEATSGITDSQEIVDNVVKACAGTVSIFSLGFGFSLNFDLLQTLAYVTGGFAQRIYPGSDAASQLENFYMKISTPLMYDINIVYGETAVDKNTVTKAHFAQYYNGSELVIAGKLLDTAPETWQTTVSARTTEDITLTKTIEQGDIVTVPEAARGAYIEGFTEKLWVYMQIKDLLQQALVSKNVTEKSIINKKAVDLAVQFNLVTPVTSMVIVQNDKVSNSWDEAFDVNLMASGAAYGAVNRIYASKLAVSFTGIIALFLMF